MFNRPIYGRGPPHPAPRLIHDFKKKIDKKILGGLVIKIGSKVIDLSLRGELRRIGKELDVII